MLARTSFLQHKVDLLIGRKVSRIHDGPPNRLSAMQRYRLKKLYEAYPWRVQKRSAATASRRAS